MNFYNDSMIPYSVAYTMHFFWDPVHRYAVWLCEYEYWNIECKNTPISFDIGGIILSSKETESVIMKQFRSGLAERIST